MNTNTKPEEEDTMIQRFKHGRMAEITTTPDNRVSLWLGEEYGNPDDPGECYKLNLEPAEARELAGDLLAAMAIVVADVTAPNVPVPPTRGAVFASGSRGWYHDGTEWKEVK